MAEEFAPIETQEAFDAAVEERLEAARQEERGKYADYDEIKKQLSTANTTNTAQADKIKQLETAALKQRIAGETGIPFTLADRLVGENEEDLRKDAETLLKHVKPQQKTPPMRNPDAKPSGNDALKRLLAGLKNN